MKSSVVKVLQVTALWFGFSAAAVAGEENQASDYGRWAPVQHLRFSDEDVEASRLDPDGDLIQAIPLAEHESLIEIRQSFEAEIAKTMERF